MSIEASLIQSEISAIINSPPKNVNFYWSAVIHTPTKDIPLFTIDQIDIFRDYNRDFWDSIQLTGQVGLGTFLNDIVPSDGLLELTLTKSPITESGEEDIIGIATQSQRFIASILEDTFNDVKGSVNANFDKAGADLSSYKTFTVQLLNPLIEQLRMKTVGGIFRNCTGADVIRVILGKESKSIKVGQDIAVKGVDVVTPNNQNKRQHVVIPHGVKLLSLPLYIQEKCGGVYNSNIGYYLQNGMWFVYPELDVTRFNDTTKTLTVIVVPENKYPGIKNTFRETANQVIIMSTRGVRHIDDSEKQQLNLGNGIRFGDASRVMEGYGQAEGNRYAIKRNENMSELLLGERKNGVNRAMVSSERFTANPFNQLSKLSRANCTHLQVTWENGNESLIYPGMPTRVVYADNENIRESYGAVLVADHYVSRGGENAMVKRHLLVSTLTIILKKEI